MKPSRLALISLGMLASSALFSNTVFAQASSPAATVRVANDGADYQSQVEHNYRPSQARSVNIELKQSMPINDVTNEQIKREDHIEIIDPQIISSTGYPVRRRENVQVDDLTIVSPTTPRMPANAFKVRSDIPVKTITASNEGTRLTGNIRGLAVDIYHFNAKRGQSVFIAHDDSHPAIEVAIFRPSMGMKFGSNHLLPDTGEYELRIVQTRSDAAHNKTPRRYDIVFSVQ